MPKFTTFKDNVFCTHGEFNDVVLNSGIIVKSNHKSSEGIVPRWFRVFEIGPDVKSVKTGDWVLVKHGRWSDPFTVTDDRLEADEKIWKVELESILAVSDSKPNDVNINADVVSAQRLRRE